KENLNTQIFHQPLDLLVTVMRYRFLFLLTLGHQKTLETERSDNLEQVPSSSGSEFGGTDPNFLELHKTHGGLWIMRTAKYRCRNAKEAAKEEFVEELNKRDFNMGTDEEGSPLYVLNIAHSNIEGLGAPDPWGLSGYSSAKRDLTLSGAEITMTISQNHINYLMVDDIGDSEMVFGKMRPRIRHRLPGIHLTVGENIGENPTRVQHRKVPAFAKVGSRENPGKNLNRIEPGPPGFAARRASPYSTGVDVMMTMVMIMMIMMMIITNDATVSANLQLKDCVGIFTDGAQTMSDRYISSLPLVKKESPGVIWAHCMIHREVLASKSLSHGLNIVLAIVIDVA
ncbi:hypothetical protein ANN_14250, partial [Periplaneta americana]